MFDTLVYAKRLREAGFTEAQAEAQAEALSAVIDQNLATKQDLKELEARLEFRMKELEFRMKELESRMKELEFRIITRLGGIIVAGFAVLGVMVSL